MKWVVRQVDLTNERNIRIIGMMRCPLACLFIWEEKEMI